MQQGKKTKNEGTYIEQPKEETEKGKKYLKEIKTNLKWT